MLESIIQFVLDLVRDHGPIVLFLAGFIENAAFLAWVLPGELLLLAGGYLIQRGQLSFELAWLSVFLGVLCGDHVAYFIGLKGGRRLVRRLPGRGVLLQVERLIQRYGGWVVVFGRFSGGLRPAVLFTIGTMGLEYRKFVLFETLGAAVWSLAWLTAGALSGWMLENVGDIGPYRPLASVGATLVLLWLAWRHRERLKQLWRGEVA